MPNSARPLTDRDVQRLLHLCAKTRYSLRNRMIVLLTFDAGLKIGEISRLTRGDMMQNGLWVNQLHIAHKRQPRLVPMTERLFSLCLEMARIMPGTPASPLILSERRNDSDTPMRPDSIAYFLYRLFDKAGLEGASSHSGRKSFVAQALALTRLVPGVTAQDVQSVSGLCSMNQLTRYLPSTGDIKTRRKLIDSFRR